MNDLEDRLRAALRDRAEDFTASAGAWERTVARARWSEAAEPRRWRVRGSLARGWLARGALARGPLARGALARRSRAGGPLARLASASFAPLAAAAALVATVVAIGAVAHFAGRSGGPSSGQRLVVRGSASAEGIAPQPPGVDGSALQQLPPGTAIVELTQATPGQVSWSYFWFGRGAKADQMCAYTISDQLPSPSSSTGFSSGSGSGTSAAAGASSGAETCGPVGLPRGRFAAWVYGTQPLTNLCEGLGITAKRVVSVTAVLPGGRQIQGIVGSGRGFRYKVWAVTYPQKDAGRTTLVFRDAAGHEVDHITGN